MDVGSDLEEQFVNETDRTFGASGTSCTEQIGVLLVRDVVHPIELIAPDR